MDHYLELRRPLNLGVVPSKIQLTGEPNALIIGRGSKANVFLYAGEHPSFISREHARVDLADGQWGVSDLNSVNGMFYNSTKLQKDKRRVLSHGDRLYFGNPQHSFFVEYEFVSVPRRVSSPVGSLLSEMHSCDPYMTDATAHSPDAALCTSPSFAPSSSSNNHAAAAASAAGVIISTHEDIPEDIWTRRIMPFLDIRDVTQIAFVSRGWRLMAQAFVDVCEIIRWRHPWSVDGLVGLLEVKHERGPAQSKPVHTIVTEGCYKVSDEHVKQLAEMSGQYLRHIDLSGTPTVTANGMLWIARHCPNIRVLIVRGCKRVGARSDNWEWLSILARNKTLEHCDLHCAGATDAAVRHLAEHSPALRRLDLGVMCTDGISDVGLTDIAQHCPAIEHLDLRGCKNITSEGVAALVLARGRTLKTLVLHSCNIGDADLRVIGEHCSALEALDIHRCSGVTNQGVRALVSGPAAIGRTLKHLDMSNLSIGDDALRFLAAADVRLESLDLRSCKNVTGAGLLVLVRRTGCTLKRLDLNGCLNVKPEDLTRVAEMCRNVLKELEVGARDEDCRTWTPAYVSELKRTFGPGTMVHDAFDFPSERVEDGDTIMIESNQAARIPPPS